LLLDPHVVPALGRLSDRLPHAAGGAEKRDAGHDPASWGAAINRNIVMKRCCA
jgi:hypothetical protein